MSGKSRKNDRFGAKTGRIPVAEGGDVLRFGKNVYLCRLFNIKTIVEMPKMKTNSGAKKRFTLTGTGKVKRKHAFKSHILTKKTTKQKRNLTYAALVSPADEANVKRLLVK